MILLTGGSGFVGTRLVRELTSRGKKLKCLARRPFPLEVETCYGDVTDRATLKAAVSDVDTIIHLAAVIRERKGATFHGVNCEGTRNLLQAATEAGVSRIIYMSNLGVAPDPILSFLYSKWQAEQEVKSSGLDYIIFRSSVMFGQGDGFVTVLAKLIRKLPIVPIIGSGKTRFQLISVQEVVRCIALALEDEQAWGKTFELGGPQHLTYEEIVDIIIETLRARRLKLHIPVPLMRPIVWSMDKLLSQPPLTPAQLAMLKADNITELDAVEKAFGFKPTPLREGIGYILTADTEPLDRKRQSGVDL